jgi:UDP-GlcNAc:undecaprenyl-phosphate/decaprenyl-phosphate GlcNAc-1-phosphate transferase
MKTYAATLLFSLFASLILTYVARWTGHRLRIVDVSGGRRLHSGVIPRVGGPAIAIATLLPILSLLYIDNEIANAWKALGARGWAVVLCSLAVTGLGLWDDLIHLRARNKLLAQIIISATAYFMGLQIKVLTLPFIGILEMGAFSLPVTVFWFVGFMNVINLIDGMDGLCAGIVAIAALALFFVAISLSAPVVALFATAVFGALLGFLRYNFNPASIFMGDSGSYFLGFILAAISITGSHKSTVVVAIATPLLAIGLPILDTTLAITRRVIAGRPIFAPDRGHIHHVLIDHGYSTRRTAVIFYAVTAILAVSGVIMVLGREIEAGVALATSVILIIYLIKVFKFNTPSNPEFNDSTLPISKANELITLLPNFLNELQTVKTTRELTDLLSELAQQANFIGSEFQSFISPEESESWTPKNVDQNVRANSLSLSRDLEFNNVTLAKWTVSWRGEQAKPSLEEKTLFRVSALMVASRYALLHHHILDSNQNELLLEQIGS